MCPNIGLLHTEVSAGPGPGALKSSPNGNVVHTPAMDKLSHELFPGTSRAAN